MRRLARSRNNSGDRSRAEPAAMSAKKYIEENGITNILDELLKDVAKERPEGVQLPK